MSAAANTRSGVFYPLGYNPSLDGLRAFSVSAVVMYHAQIPGFSWGFVGVDIFFVISGFLITSALLAEHARTGRISLPGFYWRRVLRLLPALVALCIVFLLFIALMMPGIYASLREVAVVALYAGNWVMAFKIGWLHYLGHTWSLAVEEQFYLLWPIFLIALLRLARNRAFAIFAVIVSLVILVAAWRAFLSLHGASIERLYFGSDTRIDTLLIGSALGVVSGAQWAREGISVAARWLWLPAMVVLIALPAAFTYQREWMFLGYTVIALCGAVLVAASKVDSPFSRMFGTRPFVWIGQRSYGIYLWHNMITGIGVAAFGLPMRIAGPISIIGSVLCAAASYQWVERPFLRRKYSVTHEAVKEVLQPAQVLT